ncbi:MAG TPA: histidine kinase [Pedobacter sp.]|uniref:sensor histidine kinase n=1 Tax=Pedobacter sp. TaxID=1411316 RepID=UPI002CB84BC5|nr:histidine kinase [Pedobacter sp.]HMI01370.1 histidine kinase [Pedobacter sp.]
MMPRLSKSKLITILVHVLVWSVFGIGIFFYLPIFSGIDIHYLFWIRQVITFGLLVIAFYVNAFVLVPRFLLKNHPGYYIALIIGVVIAIVILDGWSDHLFNLHRFFDEAFLKRVMKQILAHRGENILQVFTLVMSVLVLGISTSLAAVRKWQKDWQKREELEKDKITSELSLLKAQINPHFFFNTMNNIYVLTQVDADLAGQAIHQLSRMMRYLLYETHQGHAMLSQEIAFVEDYINLMQLRLTEAVKVNIDIPVNFLDMPMAPMLLLPFLENAFKHGVRTTQQSHIDILILQRSSELDITIRNSVMKDNSVSLDTNSGIGLMNTRRRLDLLYPGKYKLEICELSADNEYIVHLILNLS